jgi:hypothetical protein
LLLRCDDTTDGVPVCRIASLAHGVLSLSFAMFFL